MAHLMNGRTWPRVWKLASGRWEAALCHAYSRDKGEPADVQYIKR